MNNKLIDLALAERIQKNGDRQALETLVAKYENFAYKLALKFSVNNNLELDDVLQVARMGLLQAAKKYDPKRNLAFTTCAMYCVMGEIIHYKMNYGREIRVPIHVQTKLNKLKIKEEQDSATGLVAKGLLILRSTMVPIDPSPGYEGTIRDLADYKSGREAENEVLSRLHNHHNRLRLRQRLLDLPERERAVLELRFIQEKTLDETAALLKENGITETRLTRQRIQQIERDTLKVLAKKMAPFKD